MPVEVSGNSVVTEEPENTPVALAGERPRDPDPIDRLRPGSSLHTEVLAKLMAMVKLSKNHMSSFHTRWRAAELQYQAYLKTETFEQLKKASNQRGTPPELITLTIPYTYAAVQTIGTYLMHTFCGRAPMYQVASYRGDMVEKAQNMENVLQYGVDHERQIRKLFQYFLDGEMYGLQVMRIMWKVESRKRTIWKPQNVYGIFGQGAPQMQQVRESAVTFEGNEVRNIDPFRFYPDPRIPMDEVADRGEFVFWEEYEGKHRLKKAEADGLIKWTGDIPARPNSPTGDGMSERGRLSGGGTSSWGDPTSRAENVILLQGTVEIIPSDWGLGDSDQYEKWIFSIANEGQIIQAQALDYDHGKHPVIVGEPYSSGYEFGNVGITDMLSPMQEALSWMFNSHMFNVRAALNNTFLVNPQMVDIEDLKKPSGGGRVIKMKPAAFGQDIKNAFYQVPVQDVTAGHVGDMAVIQRFADIVSSTNDNLRGTINTGGRKSATEVRTSGESSASRLASHARLISAQSICPCAEMQTINIQQLMTEPVYLKLLGEEGAKAPLKPIGPEEVSGDFYFPVHDGTLPLDRVALLEVWREIFTVIISNPGLAQIFDAVGIFEFIGELGGAKNLSTFKVRAAGNDAVAQAVQAGNAVPATALAPGGAA